MMITPQLINLTQCNVQTNVCTPFSYQHCKSISLNRDEPFIESIISISPSPISLSSSIETINDTMHDSEIEEDIYNSPHVSFADYLSTDCESEIDDVDTRCNIKECIHLKNVFNAIKCYDSLDNGCYNDIDIATIWDSYYHLIYVHDSNQDDVEYIGQLFGKYHERNDVEQLKKIEMSHNLIEQSLYTIYRCSNSYRNTGLIYTVVTCPNNGANPSSQPTNNSNDENKRNENDRQQQQDNNNNNNNSNSGSNTSGTGDDDDKDRDGDDNKKRSEDVNGSDNDEEEEEEEEEKEEEEEDKRNEQQTQLNVNAPYFYPNNTMPISPKKGSKVIHVLDTIDEDEKEEKETKTISPKTFQRSKWDPMPIKCAGTIQIPRYFTQKIIPETIKENISNIYHFMDKSTALRANKKISKNERFVIINYDFHHKDTEEMLYCIIQKQDPAQNRGFSWIMMDKLFTKNEILREFKICEKEILPTSARNESKMIQQINYIYPIQDILETQLIHNVVDRTQWHRIFIYNKTNNKQRKVLYLTKKEFMKKIEYFAAITGKVNIIPIMILNSNKKYWIEHIYIIKIDENIHIGISMKYKPYLNRIEVTGIYLNKQFLINKHQLALPNHHCMCLDHFVSDIDDLKIGNIDEDKNRIKDLQKRHEIMKKEKDRDKDRIAIYKQFVKRFINNKIPSQQLVIEAKEALDNDDDETLRSSPIITAVSSNTNLNPINMNITNPSNPTISVPTFSSSIPSSYTLSTPSYTMSTPFSTVSTIGAPVYTLIISQNHSMMSLSNLASTGSLLPSGNINAYILPINYHPDEVQITVSNRSQSTTSNAESHIESTK